MNSFNSCVKSFLCLFGVFILLSILLEGGISLWHGDRKNRTLPEENDYTGYLKNAAFSVCFHVEGNKVETAYCREKASAPMLRLDRSGALRFDRYCFKKAEKRVKDQEKEIYSLEGVKCFFYLPFEAARWRYTSKKQIRYQDSHCLSYQDAIGIVLANCSDDVSQLWEWTLF